MRLTYPTTLLFALVLPLAVGCTTTGSQRSDHLSFHERQELEAARAEAEPSPLDRAQQAASFVFQGVPKWVWERMVDESPIDFARQLRSPLPSQRRGALLNLAERDFGKTEDYVLIYKDAALNDPDPMVRAAGVRALNLARADEPEVYRQALADELPAIRLEGIKAISNMPAEEAVPELLTMLEAGATPDLRIAAAHALRQYPRLDVARDLANTTADTDFGVAWQAAESLRYLTGQDFDYEPGPWLSYLSSAEKPFG